MYRKLIKYSVLAVILIGIIFSLIPFKSSLSPNSASLNRLPHFNISTLKANQIHEFEAPFFRVHITKNNDNSLNVLAIPVREGVFQLPEFNWGRPLLPCKSFVQDFGYQCLDKAKGEFLWYHYMKWDKDGVYVGENKWDKAIPNLITPKYKVMAKHLIFIGV